MDTQELISKYSPLIEKHWLPLSLGILGMIFFAYGLIGSFVGSSASPEAVVFEANSSSGQNAAVKTITVDIEGAVVKPGVYKLTVESRIQDGLIAAGGLSAKADREYVAKTLNLATKLTDGAKIFIPNIGEAVNGELVPNASLGETVNTLININTASEAQLDSLPGVGPVTAQKIISGRTYGSLEELTSKKIVSSKVFSQIKDRITIY